MLTQIFLATAIPYVISIVIVIVIVTNVAYSRFPKFHRVLLGRDPGTLKSIIVSKKHPQLNCSDLRLSDWKFEDWNCGNRPYTVCYLSLFFSERNSRNEIRTNRSPLTLHTPGLRWLVIYIYIYIYVNYPVRVWTCKCKIGLFGMNLPICIIYIYIYV